jgi:hypothetical protein
VAAAGRVVAASWYSAAIQLRYLQTLTEIGVEKNTTIIFPLPIDLVEQLMDIKNRGVIASLPPSRSRSGTLRPRSDPKTG